MEIYLSLKEGERGGGKGRRGDGDFIWPWDHTYPNPLSVAVFFLFLPGEEEVRGKVRAHVLRLKHNLTKLCLAAGRRSPTGPEGDQ